MMDSKPKDFKEVQDVLREQRSMDRQRRSFQEHMDAKAQVVLAAEIPAPSPHSAKQILLLPTKQRTLF